MQSPTILSWFYFVLESALNLLISRAKAKKKKNLVKFLKQYKMSVTYCIFSPLSMVLLFWNDWKYFYTDDFRGNNERTTSVNYVSPSCTEMSIWQYSIVQQFPPPPKKKKNQVTDPSDCLQLADSWIEQRLLHHFTTWINFPSSAYSTEYFWNGSTVYS